MSRRSSVQPTGTLISSSDLPHPPSTYDAEGGVVISTCISMCKYGCGCGSYGGNQQVKNFAAGRTIAAAQPIMAEGIVCTQCNKVQ